MSSPHRMIVTSMFGCFVNFGYGRGECKSRRETGDELLVIYDSLFKQAGDKKARAVDALANLV